jgi:type III secretion system FlhB-like substrate exporter
MFQICVPNQKFNEKKGVMFLQLFLNAVIKNIRIHNIPDIVEISKSMELNKFIPKYIYENFHFKCFL